MYIESLSIENYRNFKTSRIGFLNPVNGSGRAEPNNINLILGSNGSGKTSILRAAATALIPELMPRVNSRYLIRRSEKELAAEKGRLKLDMLLSKLDGGEGSFSRTAHVHSDRGINAGASGSSGQVGKHVIGEIYEERAPSFFLVGYGATRWTSLADQYTVPEARNQKTHPRYQRVASLFEDGFGLMPLEAWLPAFMFRNPSRLSQVVDFIQMLLPPGFEKVKVLEGPVLFKTEQGTELPVQALSDSYRTYIAWIGDLVYHLAMCCPPKMGFEEMEGVVLVDEVDLHLHPKWQQTILKHLSKSLPKLQFVVTSHSPLVASTLPAANILVMSSDKNGFPTVVRPDRELRGLDADQVLKTPVFGLENTRTPDFESSIFELYKKAAGGDRQATLEMMGMYSNGMDGDA